MKKCDRTYHRPETNRQSVGGTCQHTCQPSEIERCRHAWTVRYNVNGVQRDKSFRDEIDAGKRVLWGTGLKKAQDFQLELTRGKRAQGRTKERSARSPQQTGAPRRTRLPGPAQARAVRPLWEPSIRVSRPGSLMS